MASKLMSPSKPPTWNSPRKPALLQETGNDHKPQDSNTDASSTLSLLSRAPLCPIPLPSQVQESIENANLSHVKGNSEVSTPVGRSKLYFQVHEATENPDLSRKSEVLTPSGKLKLYQQKITESSGKTPDRQTISRNRFGWNQSIANIGREITSSGEDGKDVRTPSKLSRTSSAREFSKEIAVANVLEYQGYANSNQSIYNRVGTSNHSTPRSIRKTKYPNYESEGVSTTEGLGTPNRNVFRTLKYSGTSGSGNGNIRSGNLAVRSANTMSQALRPHNVDCQQVDVPYFDLEEDPSFWKDHNVQVIIRCRPLNNAEVSSQGYTRCVRQETSHTLTWISQPECRFTFDHVACEKISQEKLFKIAGIPMIDNCMSGYNSCMFAYGQTGSGKTHTMLGDIDGLEHRLSDNRGITPRIFEYLFRRIVIEEQNRKHEHLKYTCKCSFLEIYNEQITDLLEPSSTNLQMREDIKKGVYVDSLSEVEVKNVQDVIFLLLQGAANRKVAATNMNKESSRSHSVFTCVIESQWEADSMTNIRFGRLNLVDLAGSERQKSSGAEGERLKEAANINKSLSTLGLVIMILVDVAQGKQRHVPYRDSKLTFLLQDSLGGNSKTTIIANISPSISCAAETLSTLKFAQRAKFIQNNAIVNEDAAGDVLALRLQIKQLKDELHRLSRQSISRMPLSSTANLLQEACQEISVRSQAKALEKIVAGSLRREQAAESAAKILTGEIEQLNLLVKQREDDAQFNKMMLRFREDKIRRLESALEGILLPDSYQLEENQSLKEELQLLRVRLDKNPELTRFAMENIRLMDQLQRLQDFYTGGERELLIEEISALRDQVLQLLKRRLSDGAGTSLLEGEDAKGLPEDKDGILELKHLLKEKEERMQQEMARADELNRKLIDAMENIHVLEEELKKNTNALEDARCLTERLQLTETKLAAIQIQQDKAVFCNAEIGGINLEVNCTTEMDTVEFQGNFREKQVVQELGTRSGSINEKSKLQENLERTKAALEEAWRLNYKLQNEQDSCREIEQQRDQIQADAEMETIQAITLLQSEIVNLLEHQKIAQQREVENEAKIMELERELKTLRNELWLQSEIDQVMNQQQLLGAEEKVRNLEMELETVRTQLCALCSENLKVNDLYGNGTKVKEDLIQSNGETETAKSITLLHLEIGRLLEDQKTAQQQEKENEAKVKKLETELDSCRAELDSCQTELNALSLEIAKIKVLYEDAINAKEENAQPEADMGTIEAITLLQSEIVNLVEAQKITRGQEVEAEEKVKMLERELETLRTELNALSSENAELNILYKDAMKAKEEKLQSAAETEAIESVSMLRVEIVNLLEAQAIAHQREVEAEEKVMKLELELDILRTELRLQKEIVNSLEEQKLAEQQELEAKDNVRYLETELETLRTELHDLSSENAKMIVSYEDSIKAKESEFLKLTSNWETSAFNLIECLSEGNQALDAISDEVESMVKENTSYEKHNMNEDTSNAIMDDNLVEILQSKLIAARELAKETESKMRVLSDVSFATANFQRQEKITMLKDLEAGRLALEYKTLCLESLQKKVDALELKALRTQNIMVAAFLVIDRLSQRHDEMATEKSRLEDSLLKIISERENKVDALELKALRAENIMVAAFLVIDRLSQRHDEMATEKSRIEGSLLKIIAERKNEINCLHLQAMKNSAVSEEKTNSASRHEDVIFTLCEHICQSESSKEEYMVNKDASRHEQDKLVSQLGKGEDQAEYLEQQLEMVDQMNAKLLLKVHQAEDDKIITLVENQLLRDIHACHQNLVIEKWLESDCIRFAMEMGNQLVNKKLDGKVVRFQNERPIFLKKLEIERVNLKLLIYEMQVTEKEKYALLNQNEQLQKDLSAKHLHFLKLIKEMGNERSCLHDNIKALDDACANCSNSLHNLMKNWCREKTLLIFETEMSKNICQLLEWMLIENESLNNTKLQLEEKFQTAQSICYEKIDTSLQNRIVELEAVIQELNLKMQSAERKLGEEQLYLQEKEQMNICLLDKLHSLADDLDDCKVGAVVEMDMVRHVLDNELQNIERYYQQLMLERLNMISAPDISNAEVIALKTENSVQQTLLESEAMKISHYEDQIAELEMKVEHERKRCSCSSLSFQEQLMTAEFLLGFEEAFSRDMLLHMQQIIQQDSSDFATILASKLLEERIENKKKLTGKENLIAQLQSEINHLYTTCEELDVKYKDTVCQLQLQDGQIKELAKQHQDYRNAFILLEQDKQILEQFITSTRLLYKTVDGNDMDAVKEVEENRALSGNSIYFCVDDKLKADMECQRRDVEILKYELQNSCDIVAEVQASHSKSLEVLTQRELDLVCVKENQRKLEEENFRLQKQNDILFLDMHKMYNRLSKVEEMFSVSRETKKTILRLLDDVEIQKYRYGEIHRVVEHIMTSGIVNEKELTNLDAILNQVDLVLNDIEPLVQLCNKVSQDLEHVKVCLHDRGVLLNEKHMEIDAMSGIIMDLKREKDSLLEEKNRRHRGIKALQFQRDQNEYIVDAITGAHNGSDYNLEVVEGKEMKLIGLHRKIERITKWLYEEVCHDIQVAFTEGCELVLSEVEREVETCKVQSALAWRKFEFVNEEKEKKEKEILQKDEIIKRMKSEMFTLRDEVGMAKEKKGANDVVRLLEEEANQMRLEIDRLENELQQTRQSSENIMAEQIKSLSFLEENNIHLKAQVEDLTSKIDMIKEELEEKTEMVEMLEMDLIELNNVMEQQKVLSSEQMQNDLYEAIKERDSLHAELVVLNEQLEMAQEMADEQEALAVEARQVAERSKTLAEQKEEDARLLEQSVKDLERTVNALETQLGMLKSESERRRLTRDNEEREKEALKHQLLNLQHEYEEQLSISEKNQRDLKVIELKLMEAEQKADFLKKQCIEKDEQAKRYKNDIMEVMADADRQASDHQQILRSLENMLGEQSNNFSINPKFVDKNFAKPRGSSPFKCIGSSLSQQMTHDIEEELSSNRQKMEELEALASSRQKEVFMLNVRLAEAESLTHDVIRDLVGVKLDITNYKTLINNHQVQKFAEKSFAQSEETKEKEKELLAVKVKLNQFIEERESWLEEINRRQAEMMTARVAAEKLRQRNQEFGVENEALKAENTTQKKMLLELESELKKLSGQQNLQQRIHHHAKIKEENNYLMLMNEDLMSKLKRSEVLLNRVNEELARYRTADGKTHLDLDEEQRLRSKLQEVEEERNQVAQVLLTLCTQVLQVTEFQMPARAIDHVAAAEALKDLRNRLDNTERELADLKLKNKIDLEKRHLSELRSLHSPMSRSQRTKLCTSDTSVS